MRHCRIILKREFQCDDINWIKLASFLSCLAMIRFSLFLALLIFPLRTVNVAIVVRFARIGQSGGVKLPKV